MCGLFGWCIKNDAPSSVVIKLASVLPLLNEARGDHAHGAAWVADDGKVKFAKHLGEAHTNVDMFSSSRLVLGHTRYATTGDKEKVKNAHPFKYKHIVGAHNGMVSNWRQASSRWKVEAEVDSELLFYRLAEKGHFKSLAGWGVASWFDERKPDRVYLTRLSSSGDLTVVQTEAGVVWSSDASHLMTALEVAGLKVVTKYGDLVCNKLHWADADAMYWDKNKHMRFGSETPYSNRRVFGMYSGADWEGEDYSGYAGGHRTYGGSINGAPYPYADKLTTVDEYLASRRENEKQRALDLKPDSMATVHDALRARRDHVTGNVSRLEPRPTAPSPTPPGAASKREKDFMRMTDEEWKTYCAEEIDSVFGKGGQ